MGEWVWECSYTLPLWRDDVNHPAHTAVSILHWQTLRMCILSLLLACWGIAVPTGTLLWFLFPKELPPAQLLFCFSLWLVQQEDTKFYTWISVCRCCLFPNRPWFWKKRFCHLWFSLGSLHFCHPFSSSRIGWRFDLLTCLLTWKFKKVKKKSLNLDDFRTFGGDKRDRTADLLNAIGSLGYIYSSHSSNSSI